MGDGDALDNNKITIFSACCCAYNGLLMTQNCFGCMGSGTLCCCEGEVCLKVPCKPLGLVCCACRCVSPSVCIKVQSQECCCVGATAIPCDEEVPCLIGACFVICYPGMFIYKTLGEITQKE